MGSGASKKKKKNKSKGESKTSLKTKDKNQSENLDDEHDIRESTDSPQACKQKQEAPMPSVNEKQSLPRKSEETEQNFPAKEELQSESEREANRNSSTVEDRNDSSLESLSLLSSDNEENDYKERKKEKNEAESITDEGKVVLEGNETEDSERPEEQEDNLTHHFIKEPIESQTEARGEDGRKADTFVGMSNCFSLKDMVYVDASPIQEDLLHFKGWKHYYDRAMELRKQTTSSTLAPQAVEQLLHGCLSEVENAEKSQVKLFLSSTFTDTKEERNSLMASVHPALRQLCRYLGWEYDIVDMRWGIRTESSVDHKTPEICLTEVDHCLQQSAGPAFVSLLCQKYGYRPFPASIPCQHMDLFLSEINKADFLGTLEPHIQEQISPFETKTVVALINKWFWVDHNAVPPSRILQSITEHLPDYVSGDKTKRQAASRQWWLEFGLLQAALRAAAARAWPQDDPHASHHGLAEPYTVSVTECEVWRGVLRNPLAQHQAVGFVRSLPGLEESAANAEKKGGSVNPNLSNYIDFDGKVDNAAQNLLSRLKQELLPQALGPHIFPIECEWADDGVDPSRNAAYLNAFCDQFAAMMASAILDAYAKRVILSPAEKEIAEHILQFRTNGAACLGRKAEVKTILDHVLTGGVEATAGVLAVVGPSGLGKSSLMGAAAMALDSLRDTPASVLLLVRACGLGLGSSTPLALIQSIAAQIIRAVPALQGQYIRTGGRNPITHTPEMKPLSEDIIPEKAGFATVFFEHLLELVYQTYGLAKKVVIFLDGLDQLHGEMSDGLDWLPPILPNTRIVLSTLTLPPANSQFAFSLPAPEAKRIRSLEAAVNARCGDHSQLQLPSLSEDGIRSILHTWLAKDGRKLVPQQWEAVFARAIHCPSPLFLRLLYEKCQNWHSYTPPEECVLPDTIENMIEDFFHSMERFHGRVLVSAAMGLLAASRQGLTGPEIIDLLSLDDQVLNDVFEWWEPPQRRLPSALWVRLRTHCKHVLCERSGLFHFAHRQFGTVIRKMYLNTDEVRKHRMATIALYFSNGADDLREKRLIPPQPLWLASDHPNTRALTELAHAQLGSGVSEESFDVSLCALSYVEASFAANLGEILTGDLERAVQQLPTFTRLADYHTFVTGHFDILKKKHSQTFVQAYNAPSSSAPHADAHRLWAGCPDRCPAPFVAVSTVDTQRARQQSLSLPEVTTPYAGGVFCGSGACAVVWTQNEARVIRTDTGKSVCTASGVGAVRRTQDGEDGEILGGEIKLCSLSYGGELLIVINSMMGAVVWNTAGASVETTLSFELKRCVSGSELAAAAAPERTLFLPCEDGTHQPHSFLLVVFFTNSSLLLLRMNSEAETVTIVTQLPPLFARFPHPDTTQFTPMISNAELIGSNSGCPCGCITGPCALLSACGSLVITTVDGTFAQHPLVQTYALDTIECKPHLCYHSDFPTTDITMGSTYPTVLKVTLGMKKSPDDDCRALLAHMDTMTGTVTVRTLSPAKSRLTALEHSCQSKIVKEFEVSVLQRFTDMQFHPSAHYIAFANCTGHSTILDTEHFRTLIRKSAPSNVAAFVRFHPSQHQFSLMVESLNDGSIWNFSEEELHSSETEESEEANTPAALSHGQAVLNVWKTFPEKHFLEQSHAPGASMYMLTCDDEARGIVWDLNTRQPVALLPPQGHIDDEEEEKGKENPPPAGFVLKAKGVNFAHINAEGTRAVTTEHGRAFLWDFTPILQGYVPNHTLTPLAKLQFPLQTASYVAFVASSQQVVITTYRGEIYFFNAATGDVLDYCPPQPCPKDHSSSEEYGVYWGGVSANGRYFCAASPAPQMRIFDRFYSFVISVPSRFPGNTWAVFSDNPTKPPLLATSIPATNNPGGQELLIFELPLEAKLTDSESVKTLCSFSTNRETNPCTGLFLFDQSVFAYSGILNNVYGVEIATGAQLFTIDTAKMSFCLKSLHPLSSQKVYLCSSAHGVVTVWEVTHFGQTEFDYQVVTEFDLPRFGNLILSGFGVSPLAANTLTLYCGAAAQAHPVVLSLCNFAFTGQENNY